MTFTVNITRHDLTQRADVTDQVLTFKGIVRNRVAGEWTCKLGAAVWGPLVAAWPDFAQGGTPLRLAVRDGADVIVSGEIREAQLARSDATTTVELTGGDEFAEATGRLIYPQPADTAPWTVDAHHVITGRASAVIAELIRYHAGDLARPERVTPGLNVSDNGAGRSGTWEFRLASLAEAVSQVATEEGLTVHARRRSDGGITVHVGAAINRTDVVLDDAALGDYAVTLAAPTASTVIGAGTGEGTARLFAIAGDWMTGLGRRETLTDQRNISSTLSLERSAEAHRIDAAASTSFSGVLSADAAARYRWRQHYDLGDMISLRVAGTTWPVTVEGVAITIDTAGLRMEPVLGSTPRNEITKLFRDVAKLSSRLDNLEIA